MADDDVDVDGALKDLNSARSGRKRAWAQAEDEALRKIVAKNGPSKWSVVANLITGRSGKQCR